MEGKRGQRMNGKRWVMLAVCVALAALALTAGWLLRQPKQSRFSRQVGADSFFMTFYPLNGAESEEFELKAGDFVDVRVVRNEGRIGVEIGRAGASPAYVGSDVPDGSFSVRIPEDGAYRFTISGAEADGSVFLEIQRER